MMNPVDVAAHIEIHQVLYRYCRGIDRADIALVKSAYHLDAIDEHGAFTGLGVDFAEYIVSRIKDVGAPPIHQITNVLIELDGSRARVESYFMSFNPSPTTSSRLDVVFASGRYLDRFECRMNEWRIAHRKVVIDFAEEGVNRRPWARLSEFPRGCIGTKDPSY